MNISLLRNLCETPGNALMDIAPYNRNKGQTGAASRITGAGPAEWGRVLIGADVKSRTTDPETKQTTVVTALDVIGGEVPDLEWRIKRQIVADDPDDLTRRRATRAASPNARTAAAGSTPCR